MDDIYSADDNEVVASATSEITRLHLELLPNTLNAHCGVVHLEYLYSTVISHNFSNLYFSLGKDGREITGFYATTYNLKFLKNKIIKEMPIRQIFKLLFVSLFHLNEIFAGIYFGLKYSINNDCYLLTICRSPQAKKGLGSSLLTYLINEARKCGYKRVWVETMANNLNANSLYKRNGFNLINTFLGINLYLREIDH